jgi:hypothetical protein
MRVRTCSHYMITANNVNIIPTCTRDTYIHASVHTNLDTHIHLPTTTPVERRSPSLPYAKSALHEYMHAHTCALVTVGPM